MFRKWAFALPLAATVVAAAVVVPSVVSAAPAAHVDATPACTSSTPSVSGLSTALTAVQTALAPTPDPAKLAPVAGDLFNAIIAVQQAGCLPALPSSSVTSSPTNAPTTTVPPSSSQPSSPPSAPAAAPQAATAQAATPAGCQSDAVSFLSAALGLVSAALASPPNPTAVTTGLSSLATAVTGVNTDSCLPAALPVPSLPPAP